MVINHTLMDTNVFSKTPVLKCTYSLWFWFINPTTSIYVLQSRQGKLSSFLDSNLPFETVKRF